MLLEMHSSGSTSPTPDEGQHVEFFKAAWAAGSACAIKGRGCAAKPMLRKDVGTAGPQGSPDILAQMMRQQPCHPQFWL